MSEEDDKRREHYHFIINRFHEHLIQENNDEYGQASLAEYRRVAKTHSDSLRTEFPDHGDEELGFIVTAVAGLLTETILYSDMSPLEVMSLMGLMGHELTSVGRLGDVEDLS